MSSVEGTEVVSQTLNCDGIQQFSSRIKASLMKNTVKVLSVKVLLFVLLFYSPWLENISNWHPQMVDRITMSVVS